MACVCSDVKRYAEAVTHGRAVADRPDLCIDREVPTPWPRTGGPQTWSPVAVATQQRDAAALHHAPPRFVLGRTFLLNVTALYSPAANVTCGDIPNWKDSNRKKGLL